MKTGTNILCFFILVSCGSWSQIKPIMNLGYSAQFTTSRFQEFQLGIGVELKDRYMLQVNFRNSYYEYDMSPVYTTPMSTDIVSLSYGMGLTKKKYRVRPLIFTEIGTSVHSNANKELIYRDFDITQKYSEGDYKYRRALFFWKLMPMCGIQLNRVNLLFGVSYNWHMYSMSDLKPYPGKEGEYYELGYRHMLDAKWGIEGGIIYTFPSKKEEKKVIQNTNLSYRPVIAVGYMNSFYPKFMAHEIEVKGGVYLNNQSSVELFFRGLASKETPAEEEYAAQHQMLHAGLQYTYHCIDYWISPVLAINGGTVIHSNAKGEYINNDLSINKEQITKHRYNYGSFVGKAKLLLAIKFKDMEVQMGNNFNYYLINTRRKKVVHTGYFTSHEVDVNGFTRLYTMGWEVNLSYTFKRKKQKENE